MSYLSKNDNSSQKSCMNNVHWTFSPELHGQTSSPLQKRDV